ncbi:MAG TPA: hypothetical protein DHV62_00555 [Elusimicrobia bacterium]|jgi:lipopolysaccharide export system permease protein|nr:hypothetical protein [Elusimicrobiota bacterium]
MKIISRYLLKNFFSPFIVALSIFSLLFILERFFEKLEMFLIYHATFSHVLEYLLFCLPYWIVQISPLAILVGLLFSLSKLSSNNEIIALKSSGISSYLFLFPIFIAVLFFTIFVFFVNENFVPRANAHAYYIRRFKIQKSNPEDKRIQEKFVYIGKGKKFFTIDFFDGKTGVIRGINIDEYDQTFNLSKQILAKEVHYKDGQWYFYQGLIREFLPGKETFREEKFKEKIFPLDEKIEDFLITEKKVDEMNNQELKEYIQRLKGQGIPARKEEINLQLRFAYPFSNLVMFFLALPFALSQKFGKGGRIRSFAFSLGFAFLYWGLLSLFRALGENNRLSVFLSAWSANFIFLFTGLFLFWVKERI